jgi:hypothetical protein
VTADGETPGICVIDGYASRSGDLRSVTKISDFYSARQWHSTGMHCDFFRPLGWTIRSS